MILERYSYAETETEGCLYINDDEFVYTLERPWVPGMAGGMPFESCVPDGDYELIPHTRPNGDAVYALRNTGLGVYYTKQERGDNDGRYLILIHSANFVSEVVGCIAPGLVRTIYNNTRMVRSSRNAMKEIMEDKHTELTIRTCLGTKEES